MSSKIKILFIITYLELGGAQKQLLSLLKNLDPDRFSLTLCAGNRGYLKKEFLTLSGVKIRLLSSLTRQINPFLDLITFLKLFFFIKKNKFDIVHTHSPKASILGRWAAYLAGARNIVYTVHGWPFHEFMNLLSYCFYLFLEKFTAKITKKIIVVSKADLAIGLRKKVAAAHKFSFIHYGIEIEKFDKVHKERGAIPSNTVITISSFKPQKGIFYFLQLAKALSRKKPRLNFIIAGDGPLRKKISREITLIGLENKVQLAGWVDDISGLLRQASLFVLTSLWEGLPLSLIEVVVSGLPAVVTNTGGVFDIMKPDKQGIMVEPANLFKLKAASLEILQNYEKWSIIVRTNRDKMDLSYWSKDRMIKETKDIYEGLRC